MLAKKPHHVGQKTSPCCQITHHVGKKTHHTGKTSICCQITQHVGKQTHHVGKKLAIRAKNLNMLSNNSPCWKKTHHTGKKPQ
jgi:hypothetical protein